MRLWPWQSLQKELEKRFNESKDMKVETFSAESFFDELRNRPKPPFYVRWYNNIRWSLNDFSWDVYRFFKPCNKRLRKVIPKRWMDLDQIIRIVNFEIFLQFYEEEYKDAQMEFDTEFVLWLEDGYRYLTIGRNGIQSKIEDEFDRLRDLPYAQQKYDLIWELEREMDEKDTVILIGIIKYRGHFWT